MFRGAPAVAVSTVLPRLPVPSIDPPTFELSQDGVARAQGRTSPALRDCRTISETASSHKHCF